jgi:hypothetical protein
MAGDHAMARDRATRAARRLVGVDRLNALVLAGRSALWLGDVASAAKALRAVDQLPVSGHAADGARLTLYAGLAARRGESDLAMAAYAEADQVWHKMDLPVPLELARRERQEWLARA